MNLTIPQNYIFHFFRRNQELIKEISSPPPGSKDLYFPTKYSQPFPGQFKACFWKQYWSY
ncbi:ABC transporter g family member 34 [Phtheirospermum japonicum]|uniref:ABC transporter g family member 34 n=1 Tax=Phtheirospermum japonicum TaxID=374723 RepID=A0A830B359_9LAMI|nr:ABC transporter g family member 34 [Phtheirospermum japonicum]